MECDGGRRDKAEGDADIFRAKEGCVEVVVFNINSHPVCIVGDNRMKKQFYNRHSSSKCGGRAVVVDSITTGSAADTIRDVP